MGKIRTETLMLVGEAIKRRNARSGQTLTDCIFLKYRKPGSNAVAARVYPRPEFASSGFGTGQQNIAIYPWEGSALTDGNEIVYAIKNGSNSDIYRGSNNLGQITGLCSGIEETSINSGVTPVVTFTSADNTGWYYPLDSGTGTKTFTADTTNTSAVLANVSSTTGCYEGQALSGTGIPAGTRILSVDSATQITMTLAATATNTGVTITREKIAKIIDADFPGNAGYTLAGTFVAMDQRLNVMTTDGYIWSSNTDSVTAWGAATKVPSVESPDGGIGLSRVGSLLAGFSATSVEFFANAGLESGSPFSTIKTDHVRVGAIAAGAIVRARNTIYWIGSGKEIAMGVFEMAGRQPKRISDTPTELALMDLATSRSYLYLSYGVLEGAEFLFIGTYDSAIVYAYQFDVGLWSTWLVYGNGKGIRQCANTNNKGNVVCYAIESGLNTGGLGRVGVVYPTPGNNSRAAGFSVRFEPTWFGSTKRKKMHALRVIGERAITGPATMSIRFSDDDNQNQKTARTVDMARSNPILRRCGGGFRTRGIEFYGTQGGGSLGFDAIEVDIEDLK